MSGWPTIQKPSISTPTTVKDNSIRSEFVNGQSASRARYTRQLREWSLKWNAMLDTDLVSLLQWYEDCAGGAASFQWTDEFNNNFTVRFAGEIVHESVGNTLSQVSVKLEEV